MNLLAAIVIIGASIGIPLGIMSAHCYAEFCLYDTDPMASWFVKVALIVFWIWLFIGSLGIYFANNNKVFQAILSKRVFKFLVADLVVISYTLALLAFNLLYWGFTFNYILDNNGFYAGWMNNNTIRRPAYYATQVTGKLLDVSLGLTMLSAAKNSISNIFGVSLRSSLAYHKVTGWLVVALTVTHFGVYSWTASVDVGQSYMSHMFNNYDPSYVAMMDAMGMNYQSWGIGNWTSALGTYGTLAWFFPILFSIGWVRRNNYELFYFTHLFLFAGFILLALHASSDFYYSIPGLCCLVIDWVYRIRARWSPCAIVRHKTVEGGLIQVDIDVSTRKDLQACKPGAFFRICVPLVKQFEWHPFSKAGNTSDSLLSVLVDPNTSWVAELVDLLADGHSIPALIDGPFGGCKLQLDNLDYLVCLAGGSGVGPCIDILQSFPGESLLVWSCKRFTSSVGLLDNFDKTTVNLFETECMPKILTIETVADGANVDEKPKLSSGTKFMAEKGRAQFDNILIENCRGKRNVGIFICGGNSFSKSAIDAAENLVRVLKGTTKVEYDAESYEM